MSFLETVERARAFLERNGRVSLRAFQREFELDDDALDDLIEELVNVQRVAVRDESVLVSTGEVPPAPTERPTRERTPRDYTPRHLADRILQSKSALEGERKQVTVLFADVKGSVELAEQVDPEEWHRILDRFFQILASGIHRFEGTVNQYTGDGIMALFGAPVAHEDHAQRACYAALQLREALRRYADELRLEAGLSFSVRIGLNSGEVVVGKIGDDLRMDYTAQGATVGLAARLQEVAAPDSICLSQRTASLVSGYFELRDLGTTRVKGVGSPVRVHELRGPGPHRTRFEVARARGLTRFVGRTAEMEVLGQALERSLAGEPQAVAVVGEAGVGKSRLCFEFVERCRARGLTVAEGRAVSHGRDLPFLPVRQIVRTLWGAGESEDARTVREKVAGRMLLIDESLVEVLPVVFDLLGVPDPERPAPRVEPDAWERTVFRTLLRIWRAEVKRDRSSFGVILFEDVHWADRASESWLRGSIERVGEGSPRGIFVFNARPEYDVGWLRESGGRVIELQPLGPDDTRAMLDALLGRDESLGDLAKLVQARAAGNPFFTEEIVRSLAESGHLQGTAGAYRLATPIDTIEIPATVQATLAARIDRLPEVAKQLLQTAAVIGRDFTLGLLEAVAPFPRAEFEAALTQLRNGEFLHEASLYPKVEYRFEHPLTQAVAYSSQLRERRREGHAAVAQAIERLAEDLDEEAALLGQHWKQAGRGREGARWYARAARRHDAANPGQALRYWQEVRGLLSPDTAGEEDARLAADARFRLLRRGADEGLSSDEAKAVFSEGEAITRRLADTDRRARVLGAYLRFVRLHSGRIDAEPEVRAGLALLDEVRSRSAVAELGMGLSLVLWGTRPRESHEVTVRAIGRLGGVEPDEIPFALRIARARTGADLGGLAAARAELEEVLALASTRGSPRWELEACVFVAAVTSMIGDSEATERHARRVLELTEEFEIPVHRIAAHQRLGMVHLMREEWEEAVDAFSEDVERREEIGGVFLRAEWLALRARALLGAGEPRRALELAKQAASESVVERSFSDRLDSALALAHVLATIDAPRHADRIGQILEDSEKRVEELGVLSWAPQVLEERAFLARALGDEKTWRRQLLEAQHLHEEIGATGHATRLARGLAQASIQDI